jgi:hypothetical protein
VLQREGLTGHAAGFKGIKDRFALHPGHARAAKDIGFEQVRARIQLRHCPLRLDGSS